MKNNKVIIALAVILIAIATFIYIRNNNVKQGTMDDMEGAKSDFAIKDTSSITKIFIADAQGVSVTLSKAKDNWIVDDKYIARPDNIRLLMKTFSRIDVRYPVPKAAFNNVVRDIATKATKVEIYQGGSKPSKVYYVGKATNDNQGTYMVLEKDGVKSTVPFVMFIPGNYGYLTSRFFTEAQQWRDAIVFKYTPKAIKSIEINYLETPEQSFIINNKDGKFSLSNIGSEKPLKVNEEKLIEYVSHYQKVYYEMVDVESKKSRIDSVIASSPYITIEVKDVIGGSNKIVLYHMPNFRETEHSTTGEVFEYDIDRMYGYLNNDVFTYVQFATFDKITYPKSYFTKE
jgi:hypothetical protein